MNKIASMGAGVVLATVLTHGMVRCAMNLAEESPPWTYNGFFQRSLFNLDVLWSRMHGRPSERDCATALRRAREAEAREALVNTAVDYSDPATGELQTPSIRGQHITLGMEQTRPASAICAATHIDDFGRFYARTVELICPAIGFALFWMLARRKVALHLWKPVALVTIAAILPLGAWMKAEPWSEIGRTLFVVLAMMWSVGAFHSEPLLGNELPPD
jgi:hypothetical protein